VPFSAPRLALADTREGGGDALKHGGSGNSTSARSRKRPHAGRRVRNGAFINGIGYLVDAAAGVPVKSLAALLCLLVSMQANADPRATVQHAFESVMAAGGFRGYAQGHVFGPGLPALSGEVEVVFPDRIHVRTEQLEFIALRQSAWINTFGVWTQTDRALLPVTAFDIAAMRQAIASIRDVKAEGTAKTSQCAAHVYRFRSSGRLPGSGGDGDLRAWLCDDSGRPARLEATDTHSAERVIVDFDWSRRADVRAPRD